MPKLSILHSPKTEKSLPKISNNFYTLHIISGSFMKKIIGLILFFVAIGMLLMMVIHNRLIGLIILALLLFAGYYLFSSCE